ncbi:hypothetical protein A2709_03370 [candidate division WWE3 bacterium RIFCSPHIGHO2_01_FULL_43_9]|uniref:Glycosyltransferase 2-like domain-containing protein n=1 Tax=candidate division WWE3 bacterium RIFCSPHIGHO2_01_FULL_43_9 TaxID=1802618 RepID=A0A1F4VAM0_UNCKA|nr:MAG: hypothetical protein A2709_03370 [candidate division WWE3 bacterium RIFCSPHIGHO2_01_FULL_43_9]
MTHSISLSIVIPTYNAKPYLSHTIDSILKSKAINYEIVIVDNASDDGTIKHLKKRFVQHLDKINFLILDKNYGPAKARNEGVKLANGAYLAFLDSDTEVDPQWANEALFCFRANKKVAAIQCKLLLLRNRKNIDYVGEYLSNTGFLTQVSPHGEADNGQYDFPHKILAAKSAGMFVTKEAFEKVGGFDEDYFIFVEETDLGWRLWLAGYEVILCPKSIVYHYFSATKDIVAKSFNNHLVRFHGTKNYILTLYKNLSIRYLIKILPIHIALWLSLAMYLIFTGNFRSGLNIFKGILWHFPNFLTNTQKRMSVQKMRVVSDSVIFESMSLMKNISIIDLVKKFMGV